MNFITGINGSGKTTIINLINALTKPSLFDLTNIEFEEVSIQIKENNKLFTIYCKQENNSIFLGIKELEDELNAPLFDLDIENLNRSIENKIDYYRDFERNNYQHQVFKFLRNLPSPLILGIRRYSGERLFIKGRNINAYSLARRSRRIKEEVSHPLIQSVAQAISLAESSYRRNSNLQEERANQLREQIILNSLRYESSYFQGSDKIKFSFIQNKSLQESVSILKATLVKMEIAPEEIDQNINPFIQKMGELGNILQGKDSSKFTKFNKEERKAFIEWIANYPNIKRIEELFKLADEFNKAIEAITFPITTYLNICNKFLEDSKKRIFFDDTYSLMVKLIDSDDALPITSLSSGESQIFIILTHLSFNPNIQKANVFIVDEPEISLHIRWQDIFVDSICEVANKDLQIILATHSPSIIQDKIENCIDLNIYM